VKDRRVNIEEFKTLQRPFDAVDKNDGATITVTGFSRLLQSRISDWPLVYFSGGGKLLLKDFLDNYEIPRKREPL